MAQTDLKIFVKLFDAGVKQTLGNLTKGVEGFRAKMANTLVTVYGIQAGFSALRGTFGSLLQAVEVQERAEKKIEQAIRSTGGAAGFTADELKKYAAELQSVTTFGDEDIMSNVTAQLLTFTNISGENFKQAQEAALNLATVLAGEGEAGGASLKSAALQLGKALNDPVSNLGALSRAGIQFSREQKETIKKLAETNQLAEAQGIILAELNKQYGGQARAMAELNSGAMKQFQNTLGDVKEEFGKILADALLPLVKGLKALAELLRDAPPWVKAFGLAISGLAMAVMFLNVSLGPVSLALTALAGIGLALAGSIKNVNKELSRFRLEILLLNKMELQQKMREIDDEMIKVAESTGKVDNVFYDFLKSLAGTAITGNQYAFTLGTISKKIEILAEKKKILQKRIEELNKTNQESININKDEILTEEERKKIIEEQNQLLEQYRKNVEAKIQATRDGAHQELETVLQTEQQKIDYMAQTGRISLEDYLLVLNERLNYVRDFFGEESLQYMQLADYIAEINRQIVESNRLSFEEINFIMRDSFRDAWNMIDETSMTGARKWAMILKGMTNRFWAMVGNMVEAWIFGEKAQTAATRSGVIERLALMAVEILRTISAAAASIVKATASIIEWQAATLGPLAIATIPATIAAMVGVFEALKSAFGFARGGIVNDRILAMVGEGGSSEAIIPLNARGAEFMAQVLPRVLVIPGQRNFDDRLLRAIENIKIEFHQTIDEIRWMRKVFPRYEKLEKRSL